MLNYDAPSPFRDETMQKHEIHAGAGVLGLRFKL
jgi:hypothetical protein